MNKKHKCHLSRIFLVASWTAHTCIHDKKLSTDPLLSVIQTTSFRSYIAHLSRSCFSALFLPARVSPVHALRELSNKSIEADFPVVGIMCVVRLSMHQQNIKLDHHRTIFDLLFILADYFYFRFFSNGQLLTFIVRRFMSTNKFLTLISIWSTDNFSRRHGLKSTCPLLLISPQSFSL